MATPIIGPIVEEPEVYEESSPLRSQPTRHRLRRASSVTMWDRGASTLQKTGATLPPLGDYKRRSQSTVSLPSNHVRGFSTLSDPFVVLAGETASPTREDEDEAISGAEEESTFVYAPVTPDHIVSKRYKRTYFHAKEYTEDTPKIRALQTSFSPRPTVISENGAFIWRPCESPEGNLYFRDEKNNVMTFVDLYDPSYREGVSGFAQFLLAKMEQEKAMPDDTELAIVLEDYGADCDYGYGYYLASWKGKCVFWLEEVDYDFVTDGARICITESHIGKHIEYLFWYVFLIYLE
ncbi:hypothetical protein BDW22DRAFT_765369 [Trametopsis cervina]|nr:hypothetical protein BDW22DRAFT_765369 [Trametopsis cervina]